MEIINGVVFICNSDINIELLKLSEGDNLSQVLQMDRLANNNRPTVQVPDDVRKYYDSHTYHLNGPLGRIIPVMNAKL